jgi:hypothetical protein
MKTVYKVLLGVSAAGLVGFVGYKLMKKKEVQPDPQKDQKDLKVNVEKRLPAIPTVPTIPTLFTQLPKLTVVNVPRLLPQDNAPSRKPVDYYADERENRFRDGVRRSMYEEVEY